MEGLAKKEWIISKIKNYLRKYSSRYHVDMVFLYGSWISGFPHIDSDIDLAILFSENVNTDEYTFSLITDMSYKLEKVLNIDVNVISIYRDFRHPMLYYNAIVLGMPLFIKDQDRFLSLKLDAISQMEDFRIFGIPWQLEIAGQVIER